MIATLFNRAKSAAAASEFRARLFFCVAASFTALALSGCSGSTAVSAIQDDAAKSVRRSDAFQSAASRGALLVAGSNAGVIVVSADTGKTWQRHELAQPSSIIALTACANGTFAALDFYQKVWIGDAAGKQWIPHAITSPITPLGITCDGRGQLWVVGSNTTILFSADLGVTWKSFTLNEDAILRTVQFVDDQHGVISGEFGLILTTQDGGVSWQKQPKIPNDFYPYAAYFIDMQNGWLAGLAGTMLHTSDGGKNWIAQENKSGVAVYTLLSQGSELYGLGDGSRVMVLRDGRWLAHDKSPAAPAFISAGSLVNAETLFAVGAGGELTILDLAAKRITVALDKKKLQP